MQSFWEREALSHFDFTIAGGGILGLFTALELSEKFPRHSIAIFEKSVFSMGASTRNAGFSCFGSASEILGDRILWGDDKTLEIVEKRWLGMKEIQRRFHSSQIDYENFGGYELFFHDEETPININELNSFLYPIFKQDVFLYSNQRIQTFGLKGVQSLLYNNLEGQLHSGKLISELVKLIQSKGVFYFSNAEIKSQTDSEKLYFETQYGRKFSTEKLIYCTNAFVPNGVENINPGRGQVLITKPIPHLKIKGCFHFDEGYYYFRNVGERVLFGGGRNLDFQTEKTTAFGINERIQLDLIQKLKENIIPDTEFQIDMQWSGIMAFSASKLPQTVQVSKNVLYAMNCNGMGVSLSPMTAKELVKSL